MFNSGRNQSSHKSGGNYVSYSSYESVAQTVSEHGFNEIEEYLGMQGKK